MDAVTGGPALPSWPPADELPRLRRYLRNERLFDGEHRLVYVESGEFRFQYDDTREYVAVNLLGRLTKLLTWRAFGEGFEVAGPTEDTAGTEFCAWLKQTNRLEELALQACRGASSRGDAVLKVRYDEPARAVRVELVNPALYYAEFDALDQTRRIAATIAQVLFHPKSYYLWEERHEYRGSESWIVNRLYKLAGTPEYGLTLDRVKGQVALTTIPATAALPEEQPTGIDELLVVHVANNSNHSSPWGISDYADLLTIQGELNNRYTQRAEVLDKFVDPFMYGPDLGDEDAQVRLGNLKYIVQPPGSITAPVGMVVWDAQLDAVEQALAELKQDFAATAGVDFSALVPQEAGGPVSGRALRLSQMQTQTTVQGKHRTFEPALQQVFSIASKLALTVPLNWAPAEGALSALQPDDITITFGDGLPSDSLEDAQEQELLLTMGVQSRHDAIMLLHGLDDESATALLAEIDAETKANAPAAPESGLGLTLGPAFKPIFPQGVDEE
jgi:hypothetical protein